MTGNPWIDAAIYLVVVMAAAVGICGWVLFAVNISEGSLVKSLVITFGPLLVVGYLALVFIQKS